MSSQNKEKCYEHEEEEKVEPQVQTDENLADQRYPAAQQAVDQEERGHEEQDVIAQNQDVSFTDNQAKIDKVVRQQLSKEHVKKWDDYCRAQVGLPLVVDESQDSDSWRDVSAQGQVKPKDLQSSISFQLNWVSHVELKFNQQESKSQELNLNRESLKN